MKLAIISHTEHYRNEEGDIVGWGPTITEINHLLDRFEEIHHVAFFHEVIPPPSSIAYQSDRVKFVALPPSGGRSLREKFTVISNLPKTLSIVKNVLNKVDVFQFRAPVGIGVYLIPYFTYGVKKKGWFKYAGNWAQENAPLGYALQRKMLKNQARKVTINGKWPGQPQQCLTFENPCLTLAERAEGKYVLENKTYQPKFTFCFVGRLEDEKGVQRIIDAFSAFENVNDYVDKVYFIGNGAKRETYERQAKEKKLPVQFHGFLSRTEVFDIYRTAHFLLLPSTASEGFPKVIAEGMNYGCIPIVSDVSSIGQYINTKNGFIVNPTTAEKLVAILNELKRIDQSQLQEKALKAYQVAENFTFARYNERIWTEILEQE